MKKNGVFKKFSLFFIIIWCIGVAIIFSLLMSQHILTMPKPKNYDLVQNALGNINAQVGGWKAYHVLLSECLCSQDVSAHLIQRKKSPLFSEETVILINEKNAQVDEKFMQSGYKVIHATLNSIVQKYGIEAAPSYHIINDKGKLVYTGGYYEQRARTDAKDIFIVQNLQNNNKVTPLPLYGCALGQSLQKYVDPLGLKYSNKQD